MHWLTHRDGPARALSVVPGVRARLPRVLGETGQVVWVTDAEGADALEIAPSHGPADGDTAAAARGGRDRPGLRPDRGARRPHGRRRHPRRAALPGRRRLRRGHRGRGLRRRRGHRAGLVAGLGLAGLVTPGAPAAAPAAPGPRRRPRDRRGRHRRPVHRHRAGVHGRRPVPGVPVPAQLRPGLRRARVRPVVPVRVPALPGAAGRGDAVAVRPAARRAPGRQPGQGRRGRRVRPGRRDGRAAGRHRAADRDPAEPATRRGR